LCTAATDEGERADEGRREERGEMRRTVHEKIV